MKSKWLAAIVLGMIPFAAAVAVCAIAASPAQADELIVSLSPLNDVAAGSTGNSFDVLLTNASASRVLIAGFTFQVLTASPDIAFIAATTATATPYIFGADSVLGPDITGFGGGSTDLGASDLDAIGAISLAAGATIGLGHVLFNVSPTAPTEIVSFNLAGFPGTSLSDENGGGLPIQNVGGGKFTINGPVAGVPEPATLLLLLLMLPLTFHRRIIRG